MKIKFYIPIILCVILIPLTSFRLQPKTIVFFGDSITQAGVKPNGYISMLGEKLKSPDYELIGAGIGGNKVYDLYLRLEDDVLKKNPSTVVIYVGINDVWHKQTHGTGTDYPKFIKFYQALISKITEQGSKVVLCTPTVIGEKKDGVNKSDEDLDKYAEAVRELAKKNNLQVCDLRAVFMDYENKHNKDNAEKGILTTDGVHLNDIGNRLVAETLLPFIK